MQIDIKDMPLSQALNAIQQLQTWRDEALQERVEFHQEYAMQEGATEDGTLMAHLWRDECLKHLLSSLREAVCDKFDPPNAPAQ